MQLGISSYTYTWAVGVPDSLPPKRLSACDLIDKASSLGLSLVQIADFFGLKYSFMISIVMYIYVLYFAFRNVKRKSL
ncbi:MAG: hypothetical protein WCS03_12500 [Bacteroidota bacterium]